MPNMLINIPVLLITKIILIIVTRSYLYLGPPTGSQYNCRLYHMDHWTLPDGDNIIMIIIFQF